MAFPSKERIAKVMERLKNAEGTLALKEKPTPLEKFRWEIHQKFVAYLLKHKITQKQMAELLEIDEAKVSKILHHRIDEFSTDRLINLYLKLNPNTQLRVS